MSPGEKLFWHLDRTHVVAKCTVYGITKRKKFGLLGTLLKGKSIKENETATQFYKW